MPRKSVKKISTFYFLTNFLSWQFRIFVIKMDNGTVKMVGLLPKILLRVANLTIEIHVTFQFVQILALMASVLHQILAPVMLDGMTFY